MKYRWVLFCLCVCGCAGKVEKSEDWEYKKDTASSDSMCWERWLLQQDTLEASEESVPAPRKRIHIDMPSEAKPRKRVNIYDYYQDHLDDYQADPEDEITFDPEIFDFLDD